MNNKTARINKKVYNKINSLNGNQLMEMEERIEKNLPNFTEPRSIEEIIRTHNLMIENIDDAWKAMERILF